jgi:hypothetical protein
MNDQPQYSEKSGFSQWIFWLVAMIPVSLFLYTRLANPHEVEPFDWFGLIIAGGVALLLYVIKLKVNINTEGISFQFPPFHNKPNLLPWRNIKSIELMRINPLKEFGGWGLRYGKLGTAYTTRGRYILHIEKTEGQAINLTIAQPEEFIKAIAQQSWPVTPKIPEKII